MKTRKAIKIAPLTDIVLYVKLSCSVKGVGDTVGDDVGDAVGDCVGETVRYCSENAYSEPYSPAFTLSTKSLIVPPAIVILYSARDILIRLGVTVTIPYLPSVLKVTCHRMSQFLRIENIENSIN